MVTDALSRFFSDLMNEAELVGSTQRYSKDISGTMAKEGRRKGIGSDDWTKPMTFDPLSDRNVDLLCHETRKDDRHLWQLLLYRWTWHGKLTFKNRRFQSTTETGKPPPIYTIPYPLSTVVRSPSWEKNVRQDEKNVLLASYGKWRLQYLKRCQGSRNNRQYPTNQRTMKLFTSRIPLGFIVNDILGLFKRQRPVIDTSSWAKQFLEKNEGILD